MVIDVTDPLADKLNGKCVIVHILNENYSYVTIHVSAV